MKIHNFNYQEAFSCIKTHVEKEALRIILKDIDSSCLPEYLKSHMERISAKLDSSIAFREGSVNILS